jgi:hypothetical protein
MEKLSNKKYKETYPLFGFGDIEGKGKKGKM